MDRKARGINPDPPGGTKGLEKYTHFNPLDYFYILEAMHRAGADIATEQ